MSLSIQLSPLSIQICSPPATPAVPAEALGFSTLEASKDSFRIRHYIIKPLGSGDNGETYAVIRKSDADSCLAESQGRHDASYYAALRRKVIVVKFAKDDNLEGDLTNEIMMLRDVLTTPNPYFTTAIETFLCGPLQWLTLPYLRGGNVQSFLLDHPEDATLGFRWHIGTCVARAILFLLYGITDTAEFEPRTNAPRVTHSDLWSVNLLLDAASMEATSATPERYPDIIVADWGRGKHYGNTPQDQAAHQEAQTWDIQTLGHNLSFVNGIGGWFTPIVSPQVQESERQLTVWQDRFQNFHATNCTPEVAAWSAIVVLQQFVTEADEQIRDHFQPLSQSARDALRKESFTDELLEATVGANANRS
ncbi:hypothetical protein LTR97_006713 [Elasticomyces elasticus]|uniref:Protein kinase domain-containing protein n=1 Tax=Elasticomyces elasticus TaxID=574655 RepID=A0AAN7W3B4_9PEZI|nr:hypothetical protein LTR97_006713 [Elasticomyces elasticus]